MDHLLTLVTFLPLVGALVVFAGSDKLARPLALLISVATFAASVPLWFMYDAAGTGPIKGWSTMQLVDGPYPWIADLGIQYHVGIDGEITPAIIGQLRHGLILDGRPLRPARINHTRPGQIEFVLTQGRKRQIRRMCELVGLRARTLVRVRIGQVLLDKLQRGQWRHLANGEVF